MGIFMVWKIYFWLIAALLVLPFPYKIFEYITDRDGSPKIVKIEEMVNAVFFGIGLIGLYGFVYKRESFNPLFWRVWVVLAIIISIAAFFWSPKFKYALDVLGKKRIKVFLAIGSLALLPMLFAVYSYSAAA